MIGIYFMLIVLNAYLGWLLKIRQSEFLEEYSLNLRQELYHAVSTAGWEQLAAGKQTDTIDLFTEQCSQISQGVSMIIALLSSVVTAFVSLGIALWLSLPVTVFVLIFGCGFAWVFRHMKKESKHYGNEMIRINRAMYSELYNQLRSIKEVRSYGVQKEHADFFDEISRSAKDAKLKFMRQQAFPSMLYSIAAAGMIAVIFLICVLLFHMDTARLMVLVYVFTRLAAQSGIYSPRTSDSECHSAGKPSTFSSGSNAGGNEKGPKEGIYLGCGGKSAPGNGYGFGRRRNSSFRR